MLGWSGLLGVTRHPLFCAPVLVGAALLAAHLALFVPGVAWLAGFVGAERAVAAGFLAFLPATLVKTALALAALRAARR